MCELDGELEEGEIDEAPGPCVCCEPWAKQLIDRTAGHVITKELETGWSVWRSCNIKEDGFVFVERGLCSLRLPGCRTHVVRMNSFCEKLAGS